MGSSGLNALTSPEPHKKTALFIATNGVGMGHLTRIMAIARRLPKDVHPILMTWSQALRLARREGFFVEYMPSLQYLRCEIRPWNDLFLRRLHELIDTYSPGLILYDGVQPHPALGELATSHPGIRRVWCRRAMWRPGKAATNIDGAALFDDVLEPGEVAEASDCGATVAHRSRVQRIAPILFPEPADLMSRQKARQQLGLTGDRPATLVQLGAGAAIRGDVVTQLLEQGATDVVVARSPLEKDGPPLPSGCVQVNVYPVGRYYRAFDFAVAAPGYNAFHELLAFDIPTLFIPNPNAVVDNQPVRARHAAEHDWAGWYDGVANEGSSGLRQALHALLDGPRPGGLSEISRTLIGTRGACEAAEFVAERLKATE